MHAGLGKWWHKDPTDGRIQCDLCPRQCRMKEGDRGFCFVRKIENDVLVLDTYGKSTGFCIDPIEKKPLNHFYPGSSVLSFGTAGCNLGCQFCQNWDISKSREVAKLSNIATPESIALAARELQCRSVAFTYNDPVVWAEYAIDTAKACRDLGIATVAVTAGYMMPEPRAEFYRWMDAANVDLKSFSEEFYRQITYSHLEPVLDTLRYLQRETDVWFEITNLVIPQANDSADELTRMCDWIVGELGPDVPVHFSAFHPDFRMMDRPNTPHEKLIEAHGIAKRAGIRFPYVGNVHDVSRASTYCWRCGELLIERDWYELGRYQLRGNVCSHCGDVQPGRFEDRPGTWGRKRQPVDIRRFQTESSVNIPQVLGNFDRISPSNPPDPKRGVSLPRQQTPAPPQSVSGFNPSMEPTMSSSTLASFQKLEMLPLDSLTTDQRHSIHRLVQQMVTASVLNGKVSEESVSSLGESGQQHVYGVFTTLKRGEHLRGCCGFQGRPTPLVEGLAESAHRTAKEDPRMPAISSIELPYLSCNVTLLDAPLPIEGPVAERPNAIVIGKHGLRISTPKSSVYGEHAGLLLPSVPVEQGWTVEQFLIGICRKAGLPIDAWRDPACRLESFEGLSIEGHFDRDLLPDPIPMEYAPGDLNGLVRLKNAAIQNMIAFSRGATPNYYVLDAMDGTVNGIVMSAINTETKRPLAHWIQTSLRPGIPLQTNLFELCKSAEQTLRRTRFDRSVDIDLELTVLNAPAHHGVIHGEDWSGNALHESLKDCDLQGIEPKHRAILALCGDRAAVALDADKTAHQLVQEAAAAVKTRSHAIAIFSVGAVSTLPNLLASNHLGVDASDAPRAAVLGNTFYPSDTHELDTLLQGFEAKSPIDKAVPALAIMTPHAGLKYSGQVAMDAWKSTEIPSRVVIVGPKHTRLGAEWAVSPATSWMLPDGTSFETDIELAKRIVESVSGMEFDSAAHSREHSAEVELPFLRHFTREGHRPQIVCIALANSQWEDIEKAAKELAGVLADVEPRPLLVISSDMNHFADDAENRRRDKIAIETLATGDPKHLLETCRKESISMCGAEAAALVMQTLKELGEMPHIENLTYDTSATASGDAARVVGYASARWVKS